MIIKKETNDIKDEYSLTLKEFLDCVKRGVDFIDLITEELNSSWKDLEDPAEVTYLEIENITIKGEDVFFDIKIDIKEKLQQTKKKSKNIER